MKKIIYCHPEECCEERRYVARWVFEDIFGFELEYDISSSKNELSIYGSHKKLHLQDVFFNQANEDWLDSGTLPKGVFYDENNIPCPYGYINNKGESHIDIFGSIFFFISRYEEAVIKSLDDNGRFSSNASWMGKNNLLLRALANEYIETLWNKMTSLWPDLERKKREFRVVPSHDIDFPSFYSSFGVRSKFKYFSKNIGRIKLPTLAKEFCEALCYPLLGWQNDPFDTLDWIMTQSEEIGVNSAFYYIPELTNKKRDPFMAVSSRQVVDQWKRISSRGHEIGVHPGYDTFNSPQRLLKAREIIYSQLSKLNISQDTLGGRQHVLRWKTPDTAVFLDSAKLDYDSTLGFADRAGFRCGTCYEFPMYDLKSRKSLSIIQRPLIVMDCTIVDERYQNLGSSDKAFEFVMKLKKECIKYNGDFTILWHNQRFTDLAEKKLYVAILNG